MSRTKKIVYSAAIAAIYAVLTLALAPISYGNIQLRISEALCILPFSFPASSYGLFAGCLIANLLNPAGINILDVVFGSLATLCGAIATSKMKKKWLAPLPMVISNGVIVGAVLAFTAAPENFFVTFAVFGAEIALSELIVGYCIGLPLLVLFDKNKKRIGITDNIENTTQK